MGCSATKLEGVAKQKGRASCPADAESIKDRLVPSEQNESGLVYDDSHLVMGRFRFRDGDDDIMGEGTFSICYKALDTLTGEYVALKMYKDKAHSAKFERRGLVRGCRVDKSTLSKFERQVAVLQSLQEPFSAPRDPSLWNEELARVNPSDLFVRLIDYSKDAKGNPGPDARDANVYIVTELAQYSLKTFLKTKRSALRPLPEDYVKTITKEVLLIMAGLHAKGYVHLDLKPENLMRFGGGGLKLIDVDGCVRVGSELSINDRTVSFSPCYCSPDWAQFVVDGESLTIAPSLDVWSVGMTLCDLVGSEPVLKGKYNSIARMNKSCSDTTRSYMRWLSNLQSVPVPQGMDDDLNDLLSHWLLVPDAPKRKTCAESLSSPYVKDCDQMVRLPTLLTAK